MLTLIGLFLYRLSSVRKFSYNTGIHMISLFTKSGILVIIDWMVMIDLSITFWCIEYWHWYGFSSIGSLVWETFLTILTFNHRLKGNDWLDQNLLLQYWHWYVFFLYRLPSVRNVSYKIARSVKQGDQTWNFLFCCTSFAGKFLWVDCGLHSPQRQPLWGQWNCMLH